MTKIEETIENILFLAEIANEDDLKRYVSNLSDLLAIEAGLNDVIYEAQQAKIDAEDEPKYQADVAVQARQI